jgi:hypothetical protein
VSRFKACISLLEDHVHEKDRDRDDLLVRKVEGGWYCSLFTRNQCRISKNIALYS